MPAPAPLTTQPDTTPAPQGSRSTSTGADVNQGHLPSRTPLATQPITTPTAKVPGATPTGTDIKHVQVPAPSQARVPAGPAIKLGSAKAAQDPCFTKVMDRLEHSAAKAREHPPAAQKSAQAQAASVPPTNEKITEAESNKVDTMQDAPTGKPDSESFLTLLRAEVAKVMPKTLGDTDNFMKGGKKEQLKKAATDNVNQQKDAATTGMKSASNAPPDTSHVQGKQVTPLPKGSGPAAPPAIGAADAVPAPKTDVEVSLQKSKQDADASLSNAHVTPQQLQKANDPRFSAVLSAKAAVDKHADTAPKQYRVDEHKTLTQATTQAVNEEKKGLAALHNAGSQAAATVQGQQLSAKGKDEAARKQVTDHVQSIYDATKKAVDSKLSNLEKEVSDLFDKSVNKALDVMTSYIDDRMNAWKWQRYLSNPFGLFLWARDQFLGLPDDVNAFYTEGRQRFTRDLDGVIVQIATLVETRLKEAKDTIAAGQKQISDYVKGLPANLQAVGQAAEKDIASRFDEMRQEVDDKKNELAQSLAQKYKEASDKADAKIKEMQDANKGLLSTLLDKLGEVVKILTQFRDRIMSLLKQGKEALDLIVADPIGFLKHLLDALKQGLMQFVKNIWKHLQAGFMQWLLGSLASIGITMPPDLSLGSILQLVLQILGLTPERIRAKAVKYIGERNVEIIEKAWQMLSALLKGGPAALWEQIKEDLSNLKEMVIDTLQNWLISTVIQVGVTKLAALSNPVGEIIEAIITIYNTVTFFIERINQIMDFVQAIISSVLNIARGNIASAANWIEQALARSIPVIIGFLADLLGVTGITEKIKSIIEKIQSKVDAALDKLIEKIVNVVKKLLDIAKKAASGLLKKAGIGKGKDDKGEGKADERTVEKSFSMNGMPHMLIVLVGPTTTIEMQSSKRDLLSNKIGRAIASLKKRVLPPPQTQIDDLIEIGQKAKVLQQEAHKQGIDPSQKLNEIPRFEDDFNKLVGLIENYSQTYHTTDIEQLLATVTKKPKRTLTDQARVYLARLTDIERAKPPSSPRMIFTKRGPIFPMNTAAAALAYITDSGGVTLFQSARSGTRKGLPHAEKQLVDWAQSELPVLINQYGSGGETSFYLVTQYVPCPPLCDPAIRGNVWKGYLEQLVGDVDFKVWHYNDRGQINPWP